MFGAPVHGLNTEQEAPDGEEVRAHKICDYHLQRGRKLGQACSVSNPKTFGFKACNEAGALSDSPRASVQNAPQKCSQF